MDRMGIVFLVSVLVMVVISVIENKLADYHAISTEKGMFKTSTTFNV